MPMFRPIAPEKLARLIGRHDSTALIDVCTDEDFACAGRKTMPA